MIEPNVLAFQNAALLEAIEEAPNGQWTVTDLASHLGRDDSNTGKTLRRLKEEGILGDPPLSGLTDEGRAQLAAYKRAKHGGERRRAKGRWPIDKLQRNPANRRIDPEAVLGLADTIGKDGVGDILMPLVLSPPDDQGVRTIWAGERRWMAATRLLQLGELPEALLEGLPFTERTADPGEAAMIAVIENSARSDLTPFEDAKMLWQAARALGLDKPGGATELARRCGRAREGDRGGVRDVQTKLQIMRDATPGDIAAYEADPAAPGAWDRLRESVRVARERASIVTTKAQRLALAELLGKAGGRVGVGVPILPAGHTAEGDRLVQYGFAILTRSERGDTAQLTQTGFDYLKAEGLIGPMSSIREALGFPPRHGHRDFTTAWLNTDQAAVAPQRQSPEDQKAQWEADRRARIWAGCEALGPRARLVLLEVADRVIKAPFGGAVSGRRSTVIGPHWPDKTGAVTVMVNTLGAGFGSGGGEPDTVSLSDVSMDWLRERGWLDDTGAVDAELFKVRCQALGLDAAAKIGTGQYWTPWLNADDPLVVNGVRYPNVVRANEAKRSAGILPRQSNGGGGSPKTAPDVLAAADRSRDLDTAAEPSVPEPSSPPAPGPRHPLADAGPQPHPTNEALRLIAVERARQVEVEGYSPEQDAEQNAEGQMAHAAAAYAVGSAGDPDAALFWPGEWDPYGFSPAGTIRDLVKAGALIVAEIERRQREEAAA